MLNYPDCPYCKNANNALSIVDVEIDSEHLKAVYCNHCKNYIFVYKDYKQEIEDIHKTLDDLDSRLDDIEKDR